MTAQHWYALHRHWSIQTLRVQLNLPLCVLCRQKPCEAYNTVLSWRFVYLPKSFAAGYSGRSPAPLHGRQAAGVTGSARRPVVSGAHACIQGEVRFKLMSASVYTIGVKRILVPTLLFTNMWNSGHTQVLPRCINRFTIQFSGHVQLHLLLKRKRTACYPSQAVNCGTTELCDRF